MFSITLYPNIETGGGGGGGGGGTLVVYAKLHAYATQNGEHSLLPSGM